MSAQQSADSAEPSTDGDEPVPHDRYHDTDRKAYNSQAEVSEAWAEGAWPSHSIVYYGGGNCPPTVSDMMDTTVRTHAAELYSSPNYRAYQFPDGAGVLMHYSTREAIRLPDGTIITNAQCWGSGFAHCSKPRSHADYALPLSAVEEFMDDGDSWGGIGNTNGLRDVIGQERGSVPYHDVRAAVADFGDYGVALGHDPSIINDRGLIAFRIEPEWVGYAASDKRSVAEAIDQMLRPVAVQASDYPVVDAAEYRKTRLDADERQAHIEAGGELSPSRSRWRDERINRQHYRADLQGEVIVRHGEWFFIPEPGLEPRQQGVQDARAMLDNHEPRREGGAVSPYPTECPACEGGHFGLDNDSREVECMDCGTTWERPVYVRGLVAHSNGDHNAVNLGDTWHRAVTHDRDVLVYDHAPGRGEGSRSRRESTLRWD